MIQGYSDDHSEVKAIQAYKAAFTAGGNEEGTVLTHAGHWIVSDLVRHSGLLLQIGSADRDLTPTMLAYRAGQRDIVLRILARIGVTESELLKYCTYVFPPKKDPTMEGGFR